MLTPGTIVDGRFEVIDQVGQGGMGVVYRARHIKMQRDVAVKVLKSALSNDTDKLKRFRREARVISVLDHPNIVQIYAIGMVTDGQPYIAMEFLAGNQLSEVIAEDGPMPWQQAIPLLLQICDALDYAHGKQIVHRDIKPSNVVLLRDESDGPYKAKLVDFGIAKSIAQTGPQLTQTEMVMGSVFYLSPGQFQGRSADAQSDIYSLGCTFFEVLTGKRAFEGDTAFETISKHCNESAPTVKATNAEANIPDDLEYLLQWMLQKDADKRPKSIAQVRACLRKILRGESIIRVDLEGAPAPKTADGTSRRRALLVLSALTGIALVATLILFVALIQQHYQQQSKQQIVAEPNLAMKDNAKLKNLVDRISSLRASKDPSVYKAYLDLAEFYLNRDEKGYLEARLVLNQAVKVMDTSGIPCPPDKAGTLYYNLAICYRSTGNLESTARSLRESIAFSEKTNRLTSRQHFELLETYAVLCNWKEAERYLQPCLKLLEDGVMEEDASHVYRLGIRSLTSLGKYQEALALGRRGPQEFGNPGFAVEHRGYELVALDATKHSITKSEIDDYTNQAGQLPDSYRSWSLICVARLEQTHHQIDKAISHYEGAVRLLVPRGPEEFPRAMEASYTSEYAVHEALKIASPFARPRLNMLLQQVRSHRAELLKQANNMDNVQLPPGVVQ